MNIIKCYGTANMGRRTTAPQWLVIHYTASTQSRKGQARNIAAMFGRSSTQASADYIVDDVECVQYNPNPCVYYCWAVGAHDAYAAGDKVSHGGKHWTSTADANVWEPGVYGWTEAA